MTEKSRRRSSAALLTTAAFALLGVITMMIPGFAPWSPSPAAAEVQVASSCKVQYLALDPADQTKINPNKEVPGAFGPEAESLSDEAKIKADLAERRNCGKDGLFDPALTAAHYVTWSDLGLTTEKVSLAEIDAFQAKIAADPTLYRAVTDELTKLENESGFSITNGISAGSMSLYMTSDGKGTALVRSDIALLNGTSAVFTHGDKVVRYRMDCGYQPWWPTAPKELPPPCTGSECVPPPPPVNPPPVEPPCTIDCEPYLEPKNPSLDPWYQGNANDGGGTNYDPGPGTYIPPQDMEQPPSTPRVDPPPPPPVTQPPGSTVDTTPPPAPEPQAPKPSAPETGCVPIPGVVTC